MNEKTDKKLTLGLMIVAILMSALSIAFIFDTSWSILFNTVFAVTATMIVLIVALILVFWLIRLFTEKGYIKYVALFVGMLIGGFVLCWLLSSGNDIDLIKYGISEGLSKLIGGAVVFSLIGGAITLGSVLALVIIEFCTSFAKSLQSDK